MTTPSISSFVKPPIICVTNEVSSNSTNPSSFFGLLETKEHFEAVSKEAENRWNTFQTGRNFIPFEPKKSDATLEEEFINVRHTRSVACDTLGYEPAEYLVTNQLIRKGCKPFAYNNTVLEYNASTICLSNQCYIACEAPQSEEDVPRFFALLHARQVTHLVRLTDSYEGDHTKCHPYWEGRLAETSTGKEYLHIPMENGTHSIRAFDMAYWLDNEGIRPEQLLQVVLRVRQEVMDSQGILLVHCVAGVGRAGTFLAALAIVDAIDTGKPLSIEEIVYRISLQRRASVARTPQYITLYRLAECYLEQKSQ